MRIYGNCPGFGFGAATLAAVFPRRDSASCTLHYGVLERHVNVGVLVGVRLAVDIDNICLLHSSDQLQDAWL